MVAAFVFAVAGSALNLDDNVAPVPALTILGVAPDCAMELNAVLLEFALPQRAHIQALDDLVFELLLILGDLSLGRRLWAPGALPLSSS